MQHDQRDLVVDMDYESLHKSHDGFLQDNEFVGGELIYAVCYSK